MKPCIPTFKKKRAAVFMAISSLAKLYGPLDIPRWHVVARCRPAIKPACVDRVLREMVAGGAITLARPYTGKRGTRPIVIRHTPRPAQQATARSGAVTGDVGTVAGHAGALRVLMRAVALHARES